MASPSRRKNCSFTTYKIWVIVASFCLLCLVLTASFQFLPRFFTVTHFKSQVGLDKINEHGFSLLKESESPEFSFCNYYLLRSCYWKSVSRRWETVTGRRAEQTISHKRSTDYNDSGLEEVQPPFLNVSSALGMTIRNQSMNSANLVVKC